MKKKIKILVFAISAILILGLIVWLVSKKPQSEDAINKRISQYIETYCADLSTCRVNIADFAKFGWDTFCFEDVGSPRSELIPAPLPKEYGFRNGKMLFISQGEVALFEEVVLNSFKLPKQGTVIFEVGANKLCYQKDETIFKVEKQETNEGYYYLLYNSTLRISEYQEKINNPEKYLPNYSELSPEEIENKINEWKKIINEAK